MQFVGHLGHQGGEALPVGPMDMGYNRKQPPGAGVEVGGLKLSGRRQKKKKRHPQDRKDGDKKRNATAHWVWESVSGPPEKGHSIDSFTFPPRRASLGLAGLDPQTELSEGRGTHVSRRVSARREPGDRVGVEVPRGIRGAAWEPRYAWEPGDGVGVRGPCGSRASWLSWGEREAWSDHTPPAALPVPRPLLLLPHPSPQAPPRTRPHFC